MKKFIGRIAALISLSAIGMLGAAALDGSWRGDLDLGAAKLPVVFNFTETAGSTACTMDSPNQNAYGLPVNVDFVSTDSVALSAASLGATFNGSIAADEIKGIFAQRGYKFPLTLQRDLPLIERRPQTPQPPYPYQSVDTVFQSADGTQLAGTFVLPESYRRGTTPMCVFVTGSGPQNRDEELFEHKPFAVIADFLGRNGVASFRYDDRGVASSKGDYAASTLNTFKEDAKAALLFARGFSQSPSGIIGHSEGGTIALLLAEEGVPDFIVSLAGMAVSGKETVLAQNKRALVNAGCDEKTIDDTMKLLNAVFDKMILQAQSGDTSLVDADAIAAQLGISLPEPFMQSLRANQSQGGEYFSSLLAVDTRKGMRRISCPVLALNGTLDTQVDSRRNLEAIRQGVKGANVSELPGLNHLFQHAVTGEVAEYGQIRETISPEALTQILTFLQSLPNKRTD